MSVVKCTIKWDIPTQLYALSTLREERAFAFKDIFKTYVSKPDRTWDPDGQRWLFTEHYLDGVIKLAEGIWRNPGEISIKRKTEVEAANVHKVVSNIKTGPVGNTRLEPIEGVMIRFIRSIPYDACRKAFLSASLELHPDKLGANGLSKADKKAATDRFATVSEAWSRIQKEIYGK